MKTQLQLFFCLAIFIQSALAASQADASAAKASGLSWATTPLDLNSTANRATELVTNANNELVTKVHNYTTVGTGLNYVDDSGGLSESRELVELQPDGTAAAVHAPLKVWFKQNLNSDDAITISTSTNRVIKTRPLGLYYFDSDSGKCAQISALQDCSAELHRPNTIVYRGALNCGDVRVKVTKAGVEVDLILQAQPPPPEKFSLSSDTARIEFWHAYSGDLSTPQRKTRVLASDSNARVEPDLVDELLDFGDLFYPPGIAFLAGNTVESPETNAPAIIRVPIPGQEGGVIVGKRWMMIDNTQALVESVRYKDLLPLLKDLPLMAQGSASPKSKSRLMAKRQLPPSRIAKRRISEPIKVASVAYKPAGLVWDYITFSSGGDYTFASDTTYYIASSFSTSSTITWQPRCCVKYAPSVQATFYGPVICSGDTNTAIGDCSILTSANDDLFGEMIVTSSHTPGYDIGIAVHIYLESGYLNAMRIRCAQTAVLYETYYGENGSFNASALESCQTGLSQLTYGNSGTIELINSTYCGVVTPLDSVSSSGSLTDICSGDSDSNGLPDAWEYRYFGHIGVDPYGDPDGDGLTNIQEYQNGTSPTTQDTDHDHVMDQLFKVMICRPTPYSNLP